MYWVASSSVPGRHAPRSAASSAGSPCRAACSAAIWRSISAVAAAACSSSAAAAAASSLTCQRVGFMVLGIGKQGQMLWSSESGFVGSRGG